MRVTMAELSDLGSAGARTEASELLSACAAGGVEPWTAVLALLLGDSATLAGAPLASSINAHGACATFYAHLLITSCADEQLYVHPAACRQRNVGVWKELVSHVATETELPEHWQTLAAAGLGAQAQPLGGPAAAATAKS